MKITNIIDLKHHLMQRGYSEADIDIEINKASNANHEQLLQYKEKINDNTLTLITTYNKTLPNIKSILEENWHLLSINESISKIYTDKPKVAYKYFAEFHILLECADLAGQNKETYNAHR